MLGPVHTGTSLPNSGVSDIMRYLAIGHRASIYTSEIGKCYKSSLPLFSNWKSGWLTFNSTLHHWIYFRTFQAET